MVVVKSNKEKEEMCLGQDSSGCWRHRAGEEGRWTGKRQWGGGRRGEGIWDCRWRVCWLLTENLPCVDVSNEPWHFLPTEELVLSWAEKNRTPDHTPAHPERYISTLP